MNGKFEVYKDKAGKFRFRLKAANRQIIMTGEAYSSKVACLGGITSIRKNSQDASNFEVYQDKSGGFRFRLRAPQNKEIIGQGESYTSRSGCRKGIASVQKNAKGADIVDAD